MLFRKIRIERVPGKTGPQESWLMIIRTEEELFQYLDMDTTHMAEAMMSLGTNSTYSHLSAPRERILSVAFQSAAMTAEMENKTVFPHEVLAKFCGRKGMAMMGLLQREGPIQVNEAGGYCTYDIFKDIWNLEVLDEVEKDSTYFPTDKDPLVKEVLFLENAERVDVHFYRKVSDMFPTEFDYNKGKFSVGKIELMKERDPRFVTKSIENSRVIAIKSEFEDRVQLTNMMKLFHSFHFNKKHVIISTSDEGKARLMAHEDYQVNSYNHEITFID